MDYIDSLQTQGGEVTPAKNDKAHRQNGLENQKLVAADYTATKPKKLSIARLSDYWLAFVGVEDNT